MKYFNDVEREPIKIKMEIRSLTPLNLSGNVSEKWTAWKQKFEIYSTAIELDKKEEKIQCAQLLHNLGEECLKIYNTFKFIETEKDKIGPLKKKFDDYFVPQKNITYERFKFFTARQGADTTEQFIRHIKKSSTTM